MPLDNFDHEPYVEPEELKADEFGKKKPEALNWFYLEDDPPENVPDEIYNARAADLNMQERALRERWPIAPDKRAQMIAQAEEIVRLAKSPRTKLAAMKVLLMADALNLRDSEQPGQHLHLHAANQESVKDVAKRLMMDSKYISFLRTLEEGEKATESIDGRPEVEDNTDFNQVLKEAGESNAKVTIDDGIDPKRKD
jgi:hypothetical protein